MIKRPEDYLVRLRPRQDTLYVSQSATVLATDRDGFIREGTAHGFFVHQTRLLSLYGYLINDKPPGSVALSNVEQHTWLGYYIALLPGTNEERDPGSGQMESISQQTLELRVSRYVGDGLHEDLDITNFTQQNTMFTLTIEVDADFADVDEAKEGRQQIGNTKRDWHERDSCQELCLDYIADHVFNHQGEIGTGHLHRGMTLRIQRATSAPTYEEKRVTFPIELGPQGTWHACLNFIPFIDGKTLQPLYSCRSFAGTENKYDRRRKLFQREATRFTAPQTVPRIMSGLTSAACQAVVKASRPKRAT